MMPARFPGSPKANAVVILVNCLGGPELEVVHEKLTTTLNTPTVLLDPPGLARTAVTLDVASGVVTLPSGPVRPAVVWVRHAEVGTLVAQDAAVHTGDALGATQWSDLLEQLGAAAAVGLPGPRLSHLARIRGAAALGVATPRTVVTTDVAAAAAALGTPQVIVKSPDFRVYVGGSAAWPEHLPRVLSLEDALVPRGRAAHPLVVQEYLGDRTELRVYDLDGGICAFRVDKADPAAIWTDPGGVEVTRVMCPAPVHRMVRRLSRAWGLRGAAYDVLVAPGEEPVFLEANPDGDWLWFERRAGWDGVSLTAAVMVRELFLRSAAAEVRPG